MQSILSKEYINELVEKRIVTSNEYSFKNILNNEGEYVQSPSISSVVDGALTHVTDGFIEQLVAKSNYDELVGYDEVVKAGQWGMDTVKIKGIEYVGEVQPYIEGSNQQKVSDVNISSYMTGIRYYETSWWADSKELAGAELQNIDLINRKIIACAEVLSQERARTNIFGYSEKGKVPVSGLLTDRNLLPYQTVESWADKTGLELYDAINEMIDLLNVQSKNVAGDLLDSGRIFRLGLPSSYRNRLNSIIPATSTTAKEALEKAFEGKIKIVYMKEFNGYEKGENIAVLFINQSDFNPTVRSMYLEKARFFGIEERGHVIRQVISSAVAGSILYQPSLFLRVKGL